MAGKTPWHIHEVDNSDRNPAEHKSQEDEAHRFSDFNFFHIWRQCCSILSPLGVNLGDTSYSHEDFAITKAHDAEWNPNEYYPEGDGVGSVDLKRVKAVSFPWMEWIVIFAPK